MPTLALRHIVKAHGDFRALDDLSLDIKDGEFICFLGPSGCGKTSLLRVIAGLDRQSSGSLLIDGQDRSDAPPASRDYGIVFQSYALFPNLTIADNIAYGLARRGKAERQARVAEMLALVGLPGIKGKYPSQISGGQQQRVALARALAPAPGLLLLDEPLSALDARVRLALRRQIRDLHDRLGLTTIMVTHDQEEALTMADRIIVMKSGRIEQSGTPRQLYAAPQTAFVADFVGTMNLFEGKKTAEDQVRLGDLTWRCPPDKQGENHPVMVAWRPEDTLFAATGSANSLTARLTALEFLGAFQRATLKVAGLPKEVLADISANQARQLDLQVGQSVTIALPAERLLLLPMAQP